MSPPWMVQNMTSKSAVLKANFGATILRQTVFGFLSKKSRWSRWVFSVRTSRLPGESGPARAVGGVWVIFAWRSQFLFGVALGSCCSFVWLAPFALGRCKRRGSAVNFVIVGMRKCRPRRSFPPPAGAFCAMGRRRPPRAASFAELGTVRARALATAGAAAGH